MKKILLSILCLFSIIAVRAEEATLSFADKAQRTSQTTTLQVWEQNGVTLTNNKGKSTSNVADYAKPARFYKNSEIIVECSLGNINQIVFTCNNASYATTLANSISNTTAVVSEKNVTVTLDGTSNSFTIEALSQGQVRMDELTVTYTAIATDAIAKPTTSVAAGTIYNKTSVELSGEGTIYYTTDGTEPTTESAVYSEAIAIDKFNTTTTIKAIAVDGDKSSDVATFTYELKVAAPAFSIKGGVYTKLTGADALKFTCETEGATIYYNNRGKDPITEGSKSYGSLSVLVSATVQAVAFVTDENGEKIYSEVTKEIYAITTVQPFRATSSIESGKQYLVVCEGKTLIPHTPDKTYGYMSGANVTVNGEFIETYQYYGFTITATETEGEYTIMGGDNRYLYATTKTNGEWYSSFNVAEDVTEFGDAAIWTISIDEDDLTATITNKASGFTVQYSTNYKNFEAKAEATNLPVLYELGEYPTMSITPANWDTVETISTITVTCEQGIATNESDDLYATYRDENYQTYDLGTGVVSEDGKSVVYTLETPLTANGTYNITFPEGLFTLDPNGLATKSEDASVSITVDNPNILEVVYANPSYGNSAYELQYLYFEFNQDIFDNVNGAVIKDQNGNVYPLAVTYTDSWGEATPYTALCLKTAEPITAPGEYTFVLRKEYVYAGTDIRMSEDITYIYTIKEALKITNITPIEGTELTSIDEMTIEFNQEVSCYAEAFYVTGPNGEEYYFTNSYDESIPYNSIRIITDTPLTAAGEYTVYITNVYVMGSWEDSINEMYTFKFDGSSITSGIEDVETENSEDAIFDITGRRVKEINKAGIYIINGKKVIVK